MGATRGGGPTDHPRSSSRPIIPPGERTMLLRLAPRIKPLALGRLAGTVVLLSLVALTAVGSTRGQDDPKKAPKADAKATPPPAPPTGQATVTPQTQKINEFLSQAWKANKLQPSRRTSDHEF